MNARQIRGQRASLLDMAEGLLRRAGDEKRELNFEEKNQYDTLLFQADSLLREAEKQEMQFGGGFTRMTTGPSYEPIKAGRGLMQDGEARALAAYLRGDRAALHDLTPGDDNFDVKIQLRSVDSTMNITTPADGGAAVPTGFSGQVAARMNEIRLSDRLGVLRIPGTGTTVNFPYESADPSAFATTAEQTDAHSNNYERDAPQLGTKAFTLVKKTKKLELTEELLDDEDANLMTYISDFIGRAMAFTHNAMLLAEVAANGSSLKTFASATAIAAGEPDSLVYHNTLSNYLDDGGSIGWVMRPSVHGAVKGITGAARLYEETPAGAGKNLLNYPVFYSNSAAEIAASAKSMYFGNWRFVGMREDPALRLIRDPYTVDGLVILKFSFRACYGVLQSGAIGYGQHPSA